MLENGFGEHNIQGIGDKHIPLIHNVMNTDVVVARSATGPPTSSTCCSTRDGRPRLPRRPQGRRRRRRRRARPLRVLVDLQRARRDQDGEAARPRARRRDHHRRHRRRRRCTRASGPRRWPPRFGGEFDRRRRRRGLRASTSPTSTPTHMIECTERDRTRIFNLGYYTWVEQQGTPFELFEAAPRPGVLARAAPLPRRVGRDDHRVQRPVRHRLTPGVIDRLRRGSAAPSARRPSTSPRPAVALPAGHGGRSPPRPAARAADGPLRRDRRPQPVRRLRRRDWRGGRSPRAHGMSRGRALRRAELDAAVGEVAGTGFRVTPFAGVRRAVRRSASRPRAACG